MMIKRSIYLIIPVLVFFISCENKKDDSVKFSYPGIIDKEYRFNVGRVIPVTIGQAIETDGDISRDGKYFFYSSNSDGGNYDIYLRSMTDITTVRITSHPSKDIMPVISPDGKNLAFVSLRDDPEGDIFVMKLKPEDIIKKEKESVAALSSMDNLTENITIEKDEDTGVITNIKDANPAWSSDGKMIAYSSSKGGNSDIWIMKPDGSDKKKLTENGGQYPSFSIDGNKIIFVSYRENGNGDIYTLDINTGKENRITNDKSIKLYPSFTSEESRIIYSSIETDTNKNGTLDLQDRSVIRYIDTKNTLSYSLTKKSDSSFKAKWLPVFTSRDYKGVILYTDISGENINLNIIPETGIIPKKLNARLQYEMCDIYLSEFDDTEKYLLSLESVYNLYNRNNDNISRAYVNRALEEAAFYYKEKSENTETRRIISLIQERSEKKDLYASFILDMINKPGELKSDADITSISRKFGSEKSGRYFIPFALEDFADVLYRKKEYNSALKVLNSILVNHSDFERISDIQTRISLWSDDLRKTGISDSAVKILNTGNANQKISIIKNLIEPFNNPALTSLQADVYLRRISDLKLKFKDEKKITAVLSYINGLLYDVKDSAEKSREELLFSITLSHPNDLTFYLSNIKLGEIERRQGRIAEAEKYFSAGINKYSRRFKTENFKERLLWLVNYYEQSGEKSESVSDFKKASETYDKLINLLTLMHIKKLYPEIYSEFSPKAHIQYIDAYTAWKGDSSIADLEKEYNDKLPVYRMDFNRAAIYGLAYIYTKKGLHLGSSAGNGDKKVSTKEVYEAFKMAEDQVDWALFIDDTFIEPYILKSWIYQYVDVERNSFGDDVEKFAGKFFPKHLWEENIVLLEKALNVNDEKLNPENEGNLHLNMANNYFLLLNYPRALKSYRLAEKYKKSFGSDIEKALFHFHLGYSLWQNDEIKAADIEIKKAYDIYSALSFTGGREKYTYQYLAIYRYFALFSRYEKKYTEAIVWYKKILRFSEENKLTVDRARYLQEIAYCYLKTGEIESAKSYLDRAASSLENYPDDERKYYLKIKLFGIIPLFSWNMGPDSVVIGENRIFYPLDTESKKLLNISMLEEIAVAENDYTEAIKILKEKISILEDSSTSVAVDGRIRSLNNLGYYSYISGKYAEAGFFFNKAGELAEKKSNLEGTKSSMMNLVNLYANVIEEGAGAEMNLQDMISVLIIKIDSYRKNYFDQRLAQERDILEKKADARDEEITEKQIFEITNKVEQETTAIYYELDTATAVLKYYLAEILYATDPSIVLKKTPEAVDFLSVNRIIFSLYKEAMKSFESAISETEKSGNKGLKSKLILNAALSYEKTGDIEKAYMALLDAKNLSEENSLSWLKIDTYHKLGNFLYSHGKEVEKTDSISMADKFFSSAISAVEEYPIMFSSHSNRVKIIYNDYINFLIETGRDARAFELAEKYAQTARIISINTLAPEFSNEYDRKRYYEYSSGVVKLSALRNDLSSLLLSGADSVSPDIVSVKKNISLQEGKLKSVLENIRIQNSAIRPYVELTGYKTPVSENDICRFHETEKGLYYWKFSKGKLVSGYIKERADSVFKNNSGLPSFVILSDTVIEMISKGSLSSSTDYIFINTLDRIPDYLKDANSITASIYSEEKGIRKALSVEADVIESGAESFADYSLVIDKTGTGKDVTPEVIFSSSVSPVCIIQTGIKSDYRYLTLLIEGAFYSGTKRVMVTQGTGSAAVLPIVKNLFGEPESVSGVKFFALGYINSFKDKYLSDSKEIHQRELSLFSEYMKKADFTKAGIYLARWNSFQKEKKSSVYISNLWLKELLSGRVKESLAVLNLYTPVTGKDRLETKLRKAYTFMYSGNLSGALKEISSFTETEKKLNDVILLNAVIKIIRDGDLSAVDVILGMKKPYGTVIPSERYFLPVAEFLFLNKNERAVKIASLISNHPLLSESEHLMLNIISGVKPPAGRSIRFDKISELWMEKDLSAQREDALKLLRGEKGFDALSAYPVLETILRHEEKELDEELIQFGKQINLKRIISKSDSIVSVILLKRIDDFYSRRGDNHERVSVLNDILNISSENSFDSMKKETLFDIAVNYALMQKYQESYDIAVSAGKIILPEDKSYTDLHLLLMDLYIKSGEYKDAESEGVLLGQLEKISPDRKFMLNLQLSRLELNRLRTLKKATVDDAVKFEKLFSTVLNLLKHNTELLNSRGYREITAQVFDEFINYKMRTGQHSDAHYYNEIKKILIASSRCGSNLFKYSGTIDIETVQQVLPAEGLYVNIAKNKNDFFVWTADKKTKKAFVIENGSKLFQKFMDDYSRLSASGKYPGSASKDITKILSQLYSIMKNKKMILISADSDSEKIPFEITGDGDYISDRSLLIYIPSLLVTSATSNSILRDVYTPELDSSAAAYIGKSAIKESGIKINSKTDINSGFIHLSSKIKYNQGRREFTFNGKNLKSVMNKNAVMFAHTDEIEVAGVNDFLLSGREFNLQAAVLNGSLIQDTNSAYFMEEFYSNIADGASLQKSFTAALNRVKSSSFSDSSNWSGYRLNLYNLNLLKD